MNCNRGSLNPPTTGTIAAHQNGYRDSERAPTAPRYSDRDGTTSNYEYKLNRL